MKVRNFIFVLIIFAIIFFSVFQLIGTDISLHVQLIDAINNENEPYPANFLYYFIVNLFSGFSKNTNVIGAVACLFLATSVALKFSYTKSIIALTGEQSHSRACFLALLLLFFFTILEPYGMIKFQSMYLGRIVPNVFHNSTSIFLFPFAIILFWNTWKLIESKSTGSVKDIFTLTLLVVIGLLIKPSFFFIYAPATVILILISYQWRLKSMKMLVPIIIGVMILAAQYFFLYELNLGTDFNSKSTVQISKPFEVWSEYLPLWYIPIGLTCSYALPIAFVILLGKTRLVRNKLFLYAVLLNLFGIIISVFIQESGQRKFDGNFFWQNTMAIYLLLMVVVIYTIKYLSSEKVKIWKGRTLIFFIALHSVSGILYLAKVLITRSIL